ncbi:hypothetical protein BDF19DRAFT_8520 [Syncephalis fuscata]|nr:hypothetical protein BDF19DRAFT_8520 [Syncephalis fuscata]
MLDNMYNTNNNKLERISIQQETDQHTLQELPMSIFRICINLTGEHRRGNDVLATMHLLPVLMQIIDRWSCSSTQHNIWIHDDLLLLSMGLLVNLVEQSNNNCLQLRSITISSGCQRQKTCWQQCQCKGDQQCATIHLARLFNQLHTAIPSSNRDLIVEQNSEQALDAKMRLTYLDVLLGYLVDGDAKHQQIVQDIIGTHRLTR